MSICSDVISPSSKPSPKTEFAKNGKNDNGDKPVKMSKAEYNRQYRLKRKVGAKLKSNSAKIVLRKELLQIFLRKYPGHLHEPGYPNTIGKDTSE
ncbi:hypothetical protein PV325_003679 [Microctonus aethiopoides]|nr:hypothetical protein PV325_003679 [Microctonus aethiopoides]